MDAAHAARALPVDYRNDARNIIEAIGNLFYLIRMDSENAGLVQSYISQAEERLSVLAELIEELPQRIAGKAPKVVPITDHLCI